MRKHTTQLYAEHEHLLRVHQAYMGQIKEMATLLTTAGFPPPQVSMPTYPTKNSFPPTRSGTNLPFTTAKSGAQPWSRGGSHSSASAWWRAATN